MQMKYFRKIRSKHCVYIAFVAILYVRQFGKVKWIIQLRTMNFLIGRSI